MQVQFDPRDLNASASVVAMIAAFHGIDAVVNALEGTPDTRAAAVFEPRGASDFNPTPEVIAAAIDKTIDDFTKIDPADAFGTGPATGNDSTGAISPAVPTIAPNTAESPTVLAPLIASPSSPELDTRGLPWDKRIHTQNKVKLADGSWRKGRGVEQALVDQVEAELRGLMSLPVPTPPSPNVTAPAVPAPPVPPSIPVAVPTAPTAPAAAPVTNFPDLMRKITALQSAGKLTIADTSTIAKSLGIDSVRDLLNRPDFIPAFDASLAAYA